MRPSFKHIACQQALEASGYARVPLLAPTEVQLLLDRLTAEVSSAWTRAPDIRGHQFSYHVTTMDEDLANRTKTFDIVREAVEPAMTRVLDRFKLITAGVVVKGPNSGHLTFHADDTLTKNDQETALTIWCPLVDTDSTNGGLRLIPGSHRLARHITGPRVPGYHWPYIETLEQHALSVDLKTGEAAIFDSRLLHGSPPNQTDSVRVAIMVSCIPNEAEAVLYMLDPNDVSRFLVFDHSEARYLRYPASAFYGGEVAEELIGSVPNLNEVLSRNEFERRLRACENGHRQPKGGFVKRLKQLFRRE